jgi:transcriptional regulator with XRE-family HTH domain
MALRFGENLRQVREHRDLSQAALAARMAGLGHAWHQSTVYKTEHGDRTAGFHEAEDLARILNVTTDRFTWDGPEAAQEAAVRAARGTLLRSWDETADSLARLRAARATAGRAVAEHEGSKYERVRDACRGLAEELADATEGAAADEGAARFERYPKGDA